MSSAGPDGPSPVIVVMGHLVVAPADREAHLARSLLSVVAARAAEGCLHFSVTADPVDPNRVVVAELWRSRVDLDRFRAQPDDGDGDPFAAIREFYVRELEVAP